MRTFSKPDLDDLNAFVSHINDLSGYKFSARLLDLKQLTLEGSESKPIDFVNFNEDECRSFLLGIRLLTQDRDGISLKRIWEIVATSEDLDQLKLLNQARTPAMLTLMDSAMFADPNGIDMTNQEVFDTFMYGAYAHKDRKHRVRFEQWQATATFPFYKLNFLMIVGIIYRSGLNLAEIIAPIAAEGNTAQQGAAANP